MRFGVSPQTGRAVVATSIDFGFNAFGPLAGRPGDTFGMACSRVSFTRPYRFLVADRASESVVETTYRCRVTKRFTLQADVQALFRQPAQAAWGERNPAVTLGLRSQLAF